jgi:hypothetical protein
MLAVFADGKMTRDLGGDLRTAEFANAIIEMIGSATSAEA